MYQNAPGGPAAGGPGGPPSDGGGEPPPADKAGDKKGGVIDAEFEETS